MATPEAYATGSNLAGKVKTLTHHRKHHRAIHKVVPWMESPLEGVDKKHLVFSQRHEANTLELFFDLFFVANLATFTAYHSITNSKTLLFYILFFCILWGSWFQITLHDVRFARDTIFERACKTGQFIGFVGIALAGSSFKPDSKNNNSFEVMCYALILIRAILFIQYVVVLGYSAAAKRTDLILPLTICIVTFMLAAGGFGAMIPGFRGDMQRHKLYIVYVLVLLVEAISIVSVSSIWRMLSFKKTHLVERMGLLTLIVIGEGAIGVTKTVSKLMGKSGLDGPSMGLVLCIILILVFLWILYFDNQPKGHYGTIRQQIWSNSHFLIHLAIVGVVEGSQQLASARYVLSKMDKVDAYIVDYCFNQHLSGAKLADKFKYLFFEVFNLDKKPETLLFWYSPVPGVRGLLQTISNDTQICSSAALSNVTAGDIETYPESILDFEIQMASAIYSGMGVKLPTDVPVLQYAVHSWKIVYVYFWSSFALLLLCLTFAMHLTRTTRFDAFHWFSQGGRTMGMILAIVLAVIAVSDNILYHFIHSWAILPLATLMLLIIILLDRIGVALANRRNRASGDPLKVLENEHSHGEHGHGEHDHDDKETGMLLKPMSTSVHSGGSVVMPGQPVMGHTPPENTAYMGGYVQQHDTYGGAYGQPQPVQYQYAQGSTYMPVPNPGQTHGYHQ